ncbi:MAG: ATP-dependent helicase [Hyphomonadaceae bacterium]|nr:ATP-dependent helicase [Hyphomonadaceae bacterium]
MAHLIPSDIPHRALKAAHTGEMMTLELLKRTLPSDYTIFHNIHWTNEWKTGASFGEADFIIVNRSGAILVIEQKNGALDESSGTLVKAYSEGDKDVAMQVHRTIDGIRRKFAWQHGKTSLSIDYLIFCPDHHLKSVSAAGLDASRIVDASRASGLGAIICAILEPGVESDHGRRALRFFEQTLALVPDVHAHIASGNRSMVRLSGGLAETLACIEMSPMRLRVSGVPGSGKSSVAVKAFETAVASGRRPLLVCYNRPLAERMRARLSAGGVVETWYGLLAKFLEDRGHKPDFSQAGERDFWVRLQDQALGETVPDHWIFDTVIVDEGQDFDPEWFQLLRVFAANDADFIWLEDPNQQLRNTATVDLLAEGFIGYQARLNHRSPDSIARFIQRVLPFSFEAANTLPGLGVGVTPYRSDDEQGTIVAKIVSDLVGRGFDHSEIVVLSLRGLGQATLGRTDKVGVHSLARFSGEYDHLGNQLASKGQLLFESIYRFKGQQAPAVIVTDIEPDSARLSHHHRLLLCAATRATVRLELVANRHASDNAALFER